MPLTEIPEDIQMEIRTPRQDRSQLLPLFLTFLKIGAFTFGGGYAMIPLIQREAGERRGWITEDELVEITAISESTPGALLATVGVVLPAFAVIILVSSALSFFSGNQIVKYAFMGVRAGVLALIVKAVVRMYRQCPKNTLSYVIMAGVFIAAGFLNVSALLLILLCALLGLFLTLRKRGERG